MSLVPVVPVMPPVAIVTVEPTASIFCIYFYPEDGDTVVCTSVNDQSPVYAVCLFRIQYYVCLEM